MGCYSPPLPLVPRFPYGLKTGFHTVESRWGSIFRMISWWIEAMPLTQKTELLLSSIDELLEGGLARGEHEFQLE